MKIDTVYDKGTHEVNEDSILLADPIFGVFDGVSGIEPYKDTEGKTGAAIASTIARDIFATKKKPLFELARDANEAIGTAMREQGVDTTRKAARWGTTAATIKLHNNTFDWLQIADSLILVILKNGSFGILPDSYYDHDLEIMIKWQQLAAKKTDNIRDKLSEQILGLRNNMNITFGALNGEKAAEKFLRLVPLH